MMVDTSLFGAGLGTLFDQVDEVGRSKFSKSCKTVGPGIDRKTNVFVLYYPVEIKSVQSPVANSPRQLTPESLVKS